jgi:hypothetical protein
MVENRISGSYPMNLSGEDAAQASIVQYLKLALPPGCIFHSIPNGAVLAGTPKKRAHQMAKLKATGLRPGAADLLVLWNGRAIYMEVKYGDGRIQTNQIQFSDDACAAGGFWACVRSIDDVQEFLTSLGIPLKVKAI